MSASLQVLASLKQAVCSIAARAGLRSLAALQPSVAAALDHILFRF